MGSCVIFIMQIPLFIWGWHFWKLIEWGIKFSCKNEEGGGGRGCSPYREIVYRKGGKHCFSLVMYGFCSSNALYLASLSFSMYLLFQVNSQSVVACSSVDYKKAFNAVLSPLKMKKYFFHMSLFLHLSYISLGQYCWKSLAERRGFKKNIKRRIDHIGGLSIEA